MKTNLVIASLVFILLAVLAGAAYLGWGLLKDAGTSPQGKLAELFHSDEQGFNNIADNFAEMLTIENMRILSETNCEHVQSLKDVFAGHDYCLVELNDQRATDCESGCSFVGVDDVDVVLDRAKVGKTEYVFFAEFMQEHHVLSMAKNIQCDGCISFTIDPSYLSANADTNWQLVYAPEGVEIEKDVVKLDGNWMVYRDDKAN